MKTFDKKGGYAGYDRNNKEREALDFYATPPEEVKNILNVLDIPFKKEDIILDNSCGAGHLIQGILNYFEGKEQPIIIGTDIKDRFKERPNIDIKVGAAYDFLNDSYNCGYDMVDYSIINPPYSIATPFIQKSIVMSNKGVLALLRLQFIETQKRYEEIFSKCPPTDIYVYVDRINCAKNGEFKNNGNSAQAYAWFWWDLSKDNKEQSTLKWIRRAGK